MVATTEHSEQKLWKQKLEESILAIALKKSGSSKETQAAGRQGAQLRPADFVIRGSHADLEHAETEAQ